MSLYCRSCVSVLNATVLQVLCQCVTCHCVAGPMSVCYMSLRCRSCVSVLHVTVLQVLCQCVTCHCVAGPVSVCYMSLRCRSCVSVLHVTVLQVQCQCVTCHSAAHSVLSCQCFKPSFSICICLFDRTCVGVFTCFCVTGPVSVCLHVSVWQDLCQCVYMSLSYRTCVSVLEQETCRRQWLGACVETECRTQPISTAHTHQSASPSGHVHALFYATGPHTCLDSTLWVSWHCGGIVLDMTATCHIHLMIVCWPGQSSCWINWSNKDKDTEMSKFVFLLEVITCNQNGWSDQCPCVNW